MPNNLRLLVKRFLLLLLIYSLCRLLFYVFNAKYFSELSAANILLSFISGLRFDVSAIIITNLLFMVMHLNPFRFFYSKWYQLILKTIFVLMNSAAILASCVDLILFRFTGKHSTADTLDLLGAGNDFLNLIPRMLLDFWYLVILFFVLVMLMMRIYEKQTIGNRQLAIGKMKFEIKNLFRDIFYYALLFALAFIGFRGGIQYRPLNILSASQSGSPKQAALILNTPFTIIKTFGKNKLSELNYFTNDEAEKIYPTIHSTIQQFNNSTIQPNIVIIILESFGKEYIGAMNNYKGYTPFLDSLIEQSLVFTNAYANGKRSIEGIPAIVAGIPALMNEPFITSAYNGNEITSLPKLLKKKNYSSTFYHGGTNGTMNFDNFCRAAGFDKYFGRKEYNNDNDFDGSWGIYDEPFLQTVASELNKTPQPFLATVFTISSHHPYSVPKKYKDEFAGGTLPIHASVRYADYSLKKFFETISKTSWFNNTLFVITADHTAISEYSFYQSKAGIYSIPIIFYKPDGSLKATSSVTAQQIDIMPSILHQLGYDEKYFSFGTDLFDTTASHDAINFINDNYQIISNGYSLSIPAPNATTEKQEKENSSLATSFYRITTDSLLQNNLVGSDTLIQNALEKKLKAFIQNYNHALLNNKMTTSH